VFVGALDSTESKRLLAADSNALYSASGELLFVRQGTLLRQSFEVTTLDLSGDPTPVAEQIANANGGIFMRWRPDGTEIFYMTTASRGKLMWTRALTR
jgi:hypothetical protein